MTLIDAFERPLRATQHCRHYSYKPGISLASGPQCARGVDLSLESMKTGLGACMPDPKQPCAKREDYTDAEREAWEVAKVARIERLGAAVGALPKPIALNSQGQVECPNCGGTLRYMRWNRGAAIECGTPYCAEARFNIAAGADWPTPVHAGMLHEKEPRSPSIPAPNRDRADIGRAEGRVGKPSNCHGYGHSGCGQCDACSGGVNADPA